MRNALLLSLALAIAPMAAQRDSWNRVWTFLDWNLDPFHAELRSSTK
jgi:hypothetical protein